MFLKSRLEAGFHSIGDYLVTAWSLFVFWVGPVIALVAVIRRDSASEGPEDLGWLEVPLVILAVLVVLPAVVAMWLISLLLWPLYRLMGLKFLMQYRDCNVYADLWHW